MKAFNSYSRILFNPALMRKVVAEIARVLPQYMAKCDFYTIAF